MTFFLDQAEPPVVNVPQQNPLPDTWSDGLAAGIETARLQNDANFIARRRVLETKTHTGWDLADRLGADAIRSAAQERGIPDSQIDLFVQMMDRRPPRMPQNMQNVIYGLAETAASDDPASWVDLEFSDEAIEDRANESLRAEYQDAQQTLDMMPSGRVSAEFLGGMIGITADAKNLPFLLAGAGGGSIMRVMGQEALINMSAEAAFLPAQFRMAERLEIADPNIPLQLAMAATAGAAFGGAIEIGARGLRYWKVRNQVSPLFGDDTLQARQTTDEVEDILTSDSGNPLGEIRALQQQINDAPYLLENPINPQRPPLTAARPGDLDPPPIRTEPLEPTDGGVRDPMPENALIETMRLAIDEAREADARAARPLVNYLSNNHRVTKQAVRQAEREGRPAPVAGENLQVHPDGWAGQELKSRGITPRTNPRLFSRSGRSDFDNLVASEMEETFPGILDATGTASGADYLDRDGFIDVLTRDAGGDASWLRTRADVQRLEEEFDELVNNQTTASDDFSAMDSDEAEFFVDLNEYEFLYGSAAGQAIANDLDRYLSENGLTFLTTKERAELLQELQRTGGDPEYLVERIAERERDFATSQDSDARQTEDIPFGETDRSGRSSDSRSEGVTKKESGGAALTSDQPSPLGQTEGTDAGEQFVAPGIEPVSQRQRLEAAQSAPMRGGDRPADKGLFDTGARAQMDIFDDLASPTGQAHSQTVAETLRADIEANGPTAMEIMTDDGRTLRSDKEVLEYLDENDEFSEIIDLCGRSQE